MEVTLTLRSSILNVLMCIKYSAWPIMMGASVITTLPRELWQDFESFVGEPQAGYRLVLSIPVVSLLKHSLVALMNQ